MRFMTRMAAVAAVLFAATMFAAPASAQATRTWISGVGSDANPCSRTAPCQTFPGAISKTAAGGEIDTLDPGGFGAVTVTKSITLANEGTGEAGILVAGTNGITVNCITDPTCVVVVRGLQINGGPIGSNSLNGIKFIAGMALIVQNCQIRNFNGGSPNGFGINFAPSSGGQSLFVDNTNFNNNGQPGFSDSGGINIQPTGGGTFSAQVTNVNAYNNAGFGVQADATYMTGGKINVNVTNSVFSGNGGNGIVSFVPAAGTTANTVSVTHTTSSNNTGGGVVANGPTAVVTISETSLTGNGIGLAAANGGKVSSYGDNTVNGNTANGSPTAPNLTKL